MRALPLIVVALAAGACHAQLADPGFETSTPLDGFPDAYGVWGGDANSISSGENGINPLTGSGMLRMDSTSPSCAIEGGSVGAVYQLVPIPEGYGAGDLVDARVWYNRVDDANTDSLFSLLVAAYDGTPDQFSTGCETVRPSIDSLSVFDEADLSPNSWSLILVEFQIPEGATYVAIGLSVHENFDPDDTPPFDGHFFDCAELTFEHPGCSIADLADPRGVLDFSDALAFLTAFADFDPDADLAEPVGVLNFDDALAFLTAFAEGCP